MENIQQTLLHQQKSTKNSRPLCYSDATSECVSSARWNNSASGSLHFLSRANWFKEILSPKSWFLTMYGGMGHIKTLCLIFLRFCSLFLACISSVTQFIPLWYVIPLSASIFKVHPKDQCWKFLLELSHMPIYLFSSHIKLSSSWKEYSWVFFVKILLLLPGHYHFSLCPKLVLPSQRLKKVSYLFQSSGSPGCIEN